MAMSIRLSPASIGIHTPASRRAKKGSDRRMGAGAVGAMLPQDGGWRAQEELHPVRWAGALT